jgi:hypothetical protein
MTLVRRVPSAVAEEALRLLYNTHADNARMPTVPSAGRISPGLSAGRLGVSDVTQVRAQSAYLRLVSIVEAYVDTTTSDLFRSDVAGLGDFHLKLADTASQDASQSWRSRKDALNKYYDVSIGACASWSIFDSSVDVRNAIAHGLGHLTPRQRNAKTRGKIMASGVRLRGDRIAIDAKALRTCLDACVTFITEVDLLIEDR